MIGSNNNEVPGLYFIYFFPAKLVLSVQEIAKYHQIIETIVTYPCPKASVSCHGWNKFPKVSVPCFGGITFPNILVPCYGWSFTFVL